MAGPPKKKQVREVKDTEETLLTAAINSEYNTCTPMLNAEFIRIRHPLKRVDIHLSTKSPEFFSTFKELCDRGMENRLFAEFMGFGANIDEKWYEVLENAKAYCAKNN